MEIYRDETIYIEVHENTIPWLKVFTVEDFKEFSECDPQTREAVLWALDVIEKEMLSYFKPEKINIASFGNYLPHVHFHIMARFKEDSHFPEPMWGEQQRPDVLQLPSMVTFHKRIRDLLSQKSR